MRDKRNHINETAQSQLGVGAHLREGLHVLLRASDYASTTSRDKWDFAIERDFLEAMGMTPTDFRWLVCQGYVEHACEVTLRGESGRFFRRGGDLTFFKRTCFVLTTAGVHFVHQALLAPAEIQQKPAAANGNGLLAAANPVHPTILPEWDADRLMLRVGQVLVKRFKHPSPNQEVVLSAFQEEGWPSRIDDPLPPRGDALPASRLQDTIKSLNRNQQNRLIRFHGDGTGQGVRWHLLNRLESCLSANGERYGR